MTVIPQPDDTAQLDNVLMTEVTSVNSELGRFVLRFLDADAGRTDALPVAAEHELAERVRAVADGLRARADCREQLGEQLRLVSVAAAEVADG